MEHQKTYSLSGELAEALEIMAAKVDSSPEALLESIVAQYAGRHGGLPDGAEERRAFPRVDISIPAMVYIEEDGEASVRYQPARIRDVSPGGMRIVCSGRKLCGRLASDFAPDVEFDVIFSFSEDMKPIRFRCRAARMEVVAEELHIGTRIVSSDAEGGALYDKIVSSGLC
ncbi:MAG: PilZ domain-containing protein [Desulfovibrionaceae bacterium]|nr:PilZ domain-containing protein [Desulfovibrionaceae bacterium]